MKKLMMILILLSGGVWAKAQGIGSFFTQQADKAKIMIEQIALQATYLSEIKNGYNIVENGLNNAHDLKNGSFALNSNYITSLSQVNPAVSSDPKIKLIADYRQQITQAFTNELSWQRQQSILAQDEISYIQSVFDNLAYECSLDVGESQMVLTPGTVQMKDEERIQRIDKLYDAMMSKYQFSMAFINKAHAFALNRQNDNRQANTIKIWYGIQVK